MEGLGRAALATFLAACTTPVVDDIVMESRAGAFDNSPPTDVPAAIDEPTPRVDSQRVVVPRPTTRFGWREFYLRSAEQDLHDALYPEDEYEAAQRLCRLSIATIVELDRLRGDEIARDTAWRVEVEVHGEAFPFRWHDFPEYGELRELEHEPSLDVPGDLCQDLYALSARALEAVRVLQDHESGAPD